MNCNEYDLGSYVVVSNSSLCLPEQLDEANHLSNNYHQHCIISDSICMFRMHCQDELEWKTSLLSL